MPVEQNDTSLVLTNSKTVSAIMAGPVKRAKLSHAGRYCRDLVRSLSFVLSSMLMRQLVWCYGHLMESRRKREIISLEQVLSGC